MTLLLLTVASAFAVRPDKGGLYHFDDTDVLASWDDPTGQVRVHYSVSGPNLVKQGDADGDGVPDFAEDVGETAADVLSFYADMGLRRPVTEEEMGLGDLGGSPAFDFYLVDFHGDADGMFGQDDCTDVPYHCAGYMVMENDFAGYGYPSLHDAVVVLTSHELFHAVQAAYDAGQPVWFSEGTATWAEEQYAPPSRDFLGFCDAYLEDVGRSLDRPPTGPVPAFAYGTAIFWDFLTTREGTSFMNDLLDGTEDTTGTPVDTITMVHDTVGDAGDDLADAWTTFADWNLATGDRAGATESYDYAGELEGIPEEAHGATIEDDNRFYPLAATYYRLTFGGGPLWFGSADDGSAVRFSLHPIADGGTDGPVGDAVATWTGDGGPARAIVDDLPNGTYWLVGTYPEPAAESVKIHFCVGDEAAAEVCAPAAADTGDTDTDTDTGSGSSEGKGCGCDSGSAGGGLWLAVVGLIGLRRRRY